MKKHLFLTLLSVVYFFTSTRAQDTARFNISILDPAYVPIVTVSGGYRVLTFTQESLNTLASSYTITDFRQAYPDSRYEHLLQVYTIRASSIDFMTGLLSAYPSIFAAGKRVREPEWLFTPNDYGKAFGAAQPELDLIDAKNAWDINKGDSNTIIGVSDQWIKGNHIDLTNKIANYTLGVNTGIFTPGIYPSHGTIVAGAIVAHTDNDTGISAVGFKCRVNSDSMGTQYMLKMSAHNLRVINGSWRDSTVPSQSVFDLSGFANEANVYNEIYENGTTAVFAAGNGNLPGQSDPCGPDCYAFPASFDHNISVSAVGHLNTGVTPFNIANNDTNAKDWHVYYNIVPTKIAISANHNDRVDICAPGYQIESLDPQSNSFGSIVSWYQYTTGTSLSAPMVSGTIGLMLTQTPCLSPYQVEYILKKTAKNLDTIPANAAYIGRLGAGRLNAYVALDTTQHYKCNNPATQTMYISGIGVNHICAPGFSSNATNPTLTPMIVNGTPPYTYQWLAIPGNTTTLSDSSIGNPYISTSYGTRLAYYLVTVTDASPVAHKVASHVVKIQLDTAGWDLAMRDSYFDMLDEPNKQATVDPRDWQIWESPDLWNRIRRDSSIIPQTPEFFSIADSNKNFMYVRVRNVGCVRSPDTGARVHMYWTKQSTGEIWSRDWKSRNDTVVSGGVTTYVPAGREITDSVHGIAIPYLNPGDTFMTSVVWHPTDPKQYANAPSSVEVCALARIETAAGPGYGIHTAESFTGTITKNVLNNNNIVTRNMLLANLGHAHPKVTLHPEVRNADAMTQVFSLQLLTDKDIHRHYAGNISDYLYATVSLGALFDRWVDSGSHGVTGTIDYAHKTITYDPSTPLRLDNIRIEPDENFPIEIVLQLRDSVAIDYTVSTHIHLRQLLKNDAGTDEVYGNVSYAVQIDPDEDPTDGKANHPATIIKTASNQFIVYPNPTDNLLYVAYNGKDEVTSSVTLTDLAGRIVLNNGPVILNAGKQLTLNTSELVPGIYFLHVASTTGISETFKITKTK